MVLGVMGRRLDGMRIEVRGEKEKVKKAVEMFYQLQSLKA